MKDFYQQVITSVLSLVLLAAILSPAIIKLSHALFEHQEQLCKEIGSVHVHEVELDCDFQKFNISVPYYPILAKATEFHPILIKTKGFNYYSFLSDFQKLHFFLRGPPLT